MVYTSGGILNGVLERIEKTLGSSVNRMFISEETINGKGVAAAPHRVSRLLNSILYLVTIVLLHHKRCTARKRATATHTHISQLNIDYCKVTLMYGRCPFPGLPTGQVLLVTHLCWLLRYRR